MQSRLIFTFSNIFLAALIVLWAWTSLAQGAAIDPIISPAKRDLGEEAHASRVVLLNDGILMKRGVDLSTKPEGETLVGRVSKGTGGLVDDWYTLAARATEENNEVELDGHGHLPRRWYTLVEIAETQEGE